MKNLSVALSFLAAIFLAIGPSDLLASPGDLYSGQLSKKEIDKFTPAGAKTLFVSGFFADALAFDSKGNLFVADTERGKIVKVTPGGVATDFATIGNPMGLAFDAAGNLFVSDASTGSIIKLTPTGASSTFKAGFNGPFGLAFDRSGNLFVSETNTTNMGRILKLTPQGAQTTFAGGLSSPEGLAFDSAGNLYEVDFSSGNIFKFTSTGVKSTFTMGLLGPRNLAIDQNNNVFVALFPTQEIFKFTPNGTKTNPAFASSVNAGGLAFEPPTAQLLNISTRASVQTGERVTIAGFIITGTDPKQVVIRGLGPSLPQAQISLPLLQDPTLDLHHGAPSIVFNNDWQTAANSNQIPVGLRPTDPRESAILTTLQPGGYTVIMAGNNATTGIGQVEVYDITSSVFSELANISTRAFVGTGDAVTIGGFITRGGNDSTQVVIRGLGPSLPVPGPLPNPTLAIFNTNGQQIAANDNWRSSQQAEIIATGLAPTNDLESAIRVTLSPAGLYTAILQGVNGGTGIGLVEVYNVK